MPEQKVIEVKSSVDKARYFINPIYVSNTFLPDDPTDTNQPYIMLAGEQYIKVTPEELQKFHKSWIVGQ